MTCYRVFYRRLVMMCFVADFLWWIVMSSTISLFVRFHDYNLYDKIRSDRVIRSNHVRQYATNLES